MQSSIPANLWLQPHVSLETPCNPSAVCLTGVLQAAKAAGYSQISRLLVVRAGTADAQVQDLQLCPPPQHIHTPTHAHTHTPSPLT